MPFSRTSEGLVAEYLFRATPIVWIEGNSDVSFYEPALGRQKCSIRKFNGISNADALIEGLIKHDYPYVIVMDGDYTILEHPKYIHRRLIFLQRYAFENYLWEKIVIETACLNTSNCDEYEEILNQDFEEALEEINAVLYELIILDVAQRRTPQPRRVIPESVEPWLLELRKIKFNRTKILEHY